MTLIASTFAWAQDGVSNADSFKQATYDLIQQTTGQAPMPDQAGISLSDLSDGPAMLLLDNTNCATPVVAEGWFTAESVSSTTFFALSPADIAAGITSLSEVVVTGTLSGGASSQTVVLSAYVLQTTSGTTISAIAQRWRAEPSEYDVDYDSAQSLVAAGGACEAACIAVWRAADAVAIAAYRARATQIAANLKLCLAGAVVACGGAGAAGGLGCVLSGACFLTLSLNCADQADIDRTAALVVLEATRNVNAIANGACVRACRAAAAPPATPAPIIVFGVSPISSAD